MTTFDKLFDPEAIAIIGASNNPMRSNGRPIRYLKEGGYRGAVYPVNPNRDHVQGLKCYGSILDVPTVPDVVVIAVPADRVPETLEDCAARGVKHVIIFSAGFAETGPEGAKVQQRLAEIAGRAGMRVLGPNCLGMYDVHSRAFLTFSGMLEDGAPEDDGIGLISQSGGYGAHIQKVATAKGLNISRWISTGNECDIDVSELIEAFARDPRIKVILTYMEGNRSGTALRDALETARRHHKPVVAIKVGRSAAGTEAIASHTAALAGSDAVYDAIFEEAGAVRANSVEEMLDVTYGLTRTKLPEGNSVAILSASGGFAVQMADYASEQGLTMPKVPAAVQEKLLDLVSFASVSNPVDMTAQVINDVSILGASLEELLACDLYDGVAVYLGVVGIAASFAQQVCDVLAPVAMRYPDKVLMLNALTTTETRQQYEAAGFMVFEEGKRMFSVFGELVKISTASARPPRHLKPLPTDMPKLEPGRNYSEADAKKIFADIGIKSPVEYVAKTAQEGAEVSEQIGFPVAVKLVSPDILHKSDIGGVVLGLESDQAVRDAITRMSEKVRRARPDAAIEGFLISPMVALGVDCLLGIRHDPVFGPVIAFGSGGVLTELLGDVAVRCAPVNDHEARQMIGETKIAGMLNGYRGSEPADLEALVRCIVLLSEFAAASTSRNVPIISAEINPLRVLGCGSGILTLDAVLATGMPGQFG